MKKILDNVYPYAMECESRRYLGCFTSLVMCVEKYDGSQPAFCIDRQDDCIICGKCGNAGTWQQMHEQLYHMYTAVSGMGMLYFDLDQPSLDHDAVAEHFLPDSIDVTMDFEGYSYQKLSSDMPEDNFRKCIVESIDHGTPVILKTKQGSYNIIAGYDFDGTIIYGYDGHGTYLGTLTEPDGYTDNNMFYASNWYKDTDFTLIMTGKIQPSFSVKDVFERLISIIESQRTVNYGSALFDLFEDDNRFADMPENELRQIYDFTNGLIGYLAESRAFVHCCFSTSFMKRISDKNLEEIEYQISQLCCNSHDTAWIPWRAIGAWEDGDHIERLRKPEIRRQVTADLQKIIDNDIRVMELLRQGLALF